MASVRKNVFWDYAGNLSGQIVSFVISVILARLLGPEEFGIVAIAMVIISIATIFSTLGFGASIINSSELDDQALNSIFFINVALGVILMALCFLTAPYVALLYKNENLEPVLQVLSVTFLFSTLQSVQKSLLNRDMRFKELAIRDVVPSVIGGVTGVVMAYQGFNIWSLVSQTLVTNLSSTILLWNISKWRPQLSFSLKAIKPFWAYSNKLFLSSVLNAVYSRFDVLLFGKLYSLSVIGNFNRARSFNQLIVRNSSESIMRVLFPYFSKLKGNVDEMRASTIKALHVISCLAFGMIAIFASCGNDLILFLYSEKWVDAIPIFYWLILASFAYPISALLVNVIRGNGNSRLFLKVEIVKKIIVTIPFVFGWKFGIVAYAQALLGAYIVNVVLNMLAVRMEIKLQLGLQLRIVTGYAIGSVMALVFIRYLNNYTDTGYLVLNIIHQSVAAFGIFLLWNFIIKSQGFLYFINLFKVYLSRFKANS